MRQLMSCVYRSFSECYFLQVNRETVIGYELVSNPYGGMRLRGRVSSVTCTTMIVISLT